MKYLIALCVLLNTTICCLAQNWQWAVSPVHTDETRSADVVTDRIGNVYVTGYFKGQINFDTIQLNSVGAEDIFIVKYSNIGQVIWAKRFGGIGEDLGTGITVDTNNSVYLAGSFSNSVLFDSNSVISHGSADVFVSKLDETGKVNWVRSGGGVDVDYVSGGIYGGYGGVSLDNNGNVLLVGLFKNTIAQYDNQYITGVSNGSDMWFAKYDNLGNLILVKSASGGQGLGGTLGISINADANNNIIISGACSQSYSYFDSMKLTNISQGIVSGLAFLVKYDSNGHLLWLHGVGGNNTSNSGASVTGGASIVDTFGNIFTTGNFSNCNLFFDNHYLLNHIGSSDNYIAKYNENGLLLWAKLIGGTNYDRNLCLDKHNYLYATGAYGGVCITGSDTLFGEGGYDSYLIKYNTSGQVIWSKSSGGSGTDFGVSIALNDDGDIYSTGFFTSTQCNFDNHSVYNVGGYDVYLAKLTQPTNNIIDNGVKKNILISPNPSDGIFNIQITPNTFQYVIITNALGNQIFKQNINKEQVEVGVSLTNITSGIYFIKLLGDKSITERIIIKK